MTIGRTPLAGRCAVVTGGSGVICGAMAKELARHGVRVAILSRNRDKGSRVVAEIREAGGTAEAFGCDVADADSVEAARSAVLETFGPADILINGAGGGHPDGNTTSEVFDPDDLTREGAKTFFDITVGGFSHIIDVNLLGTWIASQRFGRDMIGRQGATIVNISSMAATTPATKVPAYSVAKAGIDNLTKWLAVHLASAGIRVNAISPGFFLTEQNRALLTTEDGGLTDRSQKIIAHTPMRRFGEADDLLGTLLWLVNEEQSRFVTGISVPVDGGFTAYSGV